MRLEAASMLVSSNEALKSTIKSTVIFQSVPRVGLFTRGDGVWSSIALGLLSAWRHFC